MSAAHIWLPVHDALLMEFVRHGRPLAEAAKQIGVSYKSAHARHYRISGKERVRPVPRLEWTPEQVEIVRQMVDEGCTDVAIGKRLGVSSSAVGRARHRRDISRHRGTPVQEGFAEYALTHTRTECAQHYGVSTDIIVRWCMMTKVQCRKHVSVPPAPTRPANTPAQGSWRSPPPPQRDGGEVGDAMLVLQQAGMAVYRLRVVKPSAPSDMWVVGARKMHETEMLSLAKARYGMRAAA